jgi:hypothetical protein
VSTSAPPPRRGAAAEIETLACRTVAGWVGGAGRVENTGDGLGPDFVIAYRDGRSGVGEVGWHADAAVEGMWAAIHTRDKPQQIPLPQGSGYWVAASWGRPPKIKRLYDEVPELVSEMIAEGVDAVVIHGSSPRGPLADRVRRLGLVRIVCSNRQGRDVAVFVAPGGGFEMTDPNGIADWFEQVLSDPDYADTSAKLLAVDADERHVFLMTGSRTEYGVEERIRRARDALPTRDPVLPKGITHLWGAARPGAPQPRAVLWSHRGWQTVAIPP